MADRVGQQFGNYRLVRLLGQGGFADVYLAEHIHLETQAAVKVLSMRLTSDNVEQFRAEARTVARLIHPHIVRVLDFGVEQGTPYLAMDYAPNGSLRQHYPKGTRLSLDTIVSHIKQVAEALQYAHEKKLIHRDIKPENMLLGENQEVLLSDFGIALVAQSTRYQNTQEVVGTAAYMAPEQLQGKPRRASDQYSLGIVVYEWICGNRPFHGSFTEIYSQQLFVFPPSLCGRVPELPPAVEEVVFTALAKDPAQRFESVEAFATALEHACQTLRPIQPNTPSEGIVSTQMDTETALPFSTRIEQSSMNISTLDVLAVQLSDAVPASNALVLQEEDRSSSGNTPRQVDELLLPTHQADKMSSVEPRHVSMSPSLPEASLTDDGTSPKTATSSSIGLISGVQPPLLAGITDIKAEVARIGHSASEGADLPPTKSNLSGSVDDDLGSSHGRKQPLVIILPIVLTLLLIGGSVGAVVLGGLGSRVRVSTTSATTAIVTITPMSTDLVNTYVITAVTGRPDPALHEVGAQILTYTTLTQSKTAHATGSIPGLRATGNLTFLNTSNSTKTFDSVVLTGASGVPVSFDGPVTVPSVPPSSVTVTGFAVKVGSAGNIGALDISGSCCASGIIVRNGAFGGGQDPQTNSVIQQSDINGAADALVAALTPGAQSGLQKQVQPNELIVANTLQCNKSTFTADHSAGDHAKTVTVTVAITCKEEVYDQQGALTMAANLLKMEASKDPGPTYGLTGNIVTKVTKTLVVDTKGTLSLLIRVEGVWVYLFSADAKQNLANNIADKTKVNAPYYLMDQPGVSSVQIDISRGNTLPDAAHIAIEIKRLRGATGTATPTPLPGTPTL